MRVLSSGCAAWLLLLSACGANPAAAGNASAAAGAAGAPAVGAAGGAPAAAAGAAGSAPASGGASSAGGPSSAGAGVVGAAGAPISGAGAGGGDNGGLFDPGSSVPFDPNAGGAGGGGAVATGGSGGLSIDGNTVTSSIGGKVTGTATFTQMGTDVKVVVKLTACPSGVLGIHINDGDSCDNPGTEGKPWDGKRGNIGDTGSITCANNSANLTYTRTGGDPTTNWTIGDHNLKTDITSYVVIVSSSADGVSNAAFIGCGNFFK